MAEPQLSVRSARARDLAHRLARGENRTIADVVERALEAYEVREAGREPASAFYGRLCEQSGARYRPRGGDTGTQAAASGHRALIFVDTNVISETLKKMPDEAVIAWLVRHDAELALPTVTIAEIAFGIQKTRPDQRADPFTALSRL